MQLSPHSIVLRSKLNLHVIFVGRISVLSRLVYPPHTLEVGSPLRDGSWYKVRDGPNLHFLQIHHWSGVLYRRLDDLRGVYFNLVDLSGIGVVQFIQLNSLCYKTLVH